MHPSVREINSTNIASILPESFVFSSALVTDIFLSVLSEDCLEISRLKLAFILNEILFVPSSRDFTTFLFWTPVRDAFFLRESKRGRVRNLVKRKVYVPLQYCCLFCRGMLTFLCRGVLTFKCSEILSFLA